MRRTLPQLFIFALVTATFLTGWLAPIERALMDLRFRLLDRPASGGLVVVEIDSKSLVELDVWPWPRTHHATLLDNLREAGARAIALDIEFSSRSTEEADTALEAALVRGRGAVIMPVLKQIATLPSGEPRFTFTGPIERFRNHVRVGHVNVGIETDSLVRRYFGNELWSEFEVPSLAAELAGDGRRANGDDFHVDYSIDPTTIPRLSYADVLAGRFDGAAIAGKDVLIGATAVELGDQLSVPVHRVIAGPIVQALAYESLIQGRALARTAEIPTLAIAFLLSLLIGAQLRKRSWRTGLAISGAVAGAGFGISVAIQAHVPIIVDAAPMVLVPLLSYLIGLFRLIDNQALSIFSERMLSLHRRAMMNAVVENSFDGIVITDSDGRIQESNAAADGLIGWEPGVARDKHIGAFIPNAESIKDDFCNLIIADNDRSTASPQPVEIEIARQDGTAFTMELVVTSSKMSMTSLSVKTRKLDRVLFIYTFRDITERRRAQEAQKKAMEEAVSANRVKTEFLANMSHELRTPLNAVLGFARIIQAETLGPIGATEYKNYIGEIARSGEHLLDIINDILDMAKIETGKIELNERQIGLENVIGSCLTLIRPRAEERRITVSLESSDALPWLLADQRIVKQMLLNLLSNAVKFTPQGGSAVVRVRSRRDGSLAVDVADTGIGIAEEDMQKILEPFGQVDGSLQREFEGTGLGLPLVKSMIEEHGGELKIESTPGAGTTVTIIFPPDRVLDVPDGADNRDTETSVDRDLVAPTLSSEPRGDRHQFPAEMPSAIDMDDGNKLRVLVAEDNRVNQQVIRAILAVAGHRVEIVENGREAIAAVRERPYDVVLMDIHMPDMDGVEATREIRAGHGGERDIPIIAVTASAAPADKAHFLQAGMNDHVAKPVDAATLFRAIEKYCGAPVPTGGREAERPEASATPAATATDKAENSLNELNLLLDESFENFG